MHTYKIQRAIKSAKPYNVENFELILYTTSGAAEAATKR